MSLWYTFYGLDFSPSSIGVKYFLIVLLLSEHGYFSLNFASHGGFLPPPPPNTIRVKGLKLCPLIIIILIKTNIFKDAFSVFICFIAILTFSWHLFHICIADFTFYRSPTCNTIFSSKGSRKKK